MASTQSRTSINDVSQVTSYSSNTPSALRKYDLAILRNLEHKHILSEEHRTRKHCGKGCEIHLQKGCITRFKKRITREIKDSLCRSRFYVKKVHVCCCTLPVPGWNTGPPQVTSQQFGWVALTIHQYLLKILLGLANITQ